jgi:transcriptional regulator of stress and heat shock response
MEFLVCFLEILTVELNTKQYYYLIKVKESQSKFSEGRLIMARLSDIIESFIKGLIEEAEEEELQIQRNELANYFSCAPSQINYVLTTRFTIDKGYYIESRRGGGGYIVIKKLEFGKYKSLHEAVSEKIGNSITYDSGVQIINGLLEGNIITEREAELMKVVINDRSLGILENRNKIRADLLKAMITTIIY